MRTKTFSAPLLATLLWLGCAFAPPLHAQDLHFSQADLHPVVLNPATAGMYRPDWRATAQYRSQWETVPVQYRTLATSIDGKVLRRGNNMLSAGLLLAQDRAGDAKLSWTQIGLRLGVAHALTQQHALSVGFGTDMVQRSFDIGGLTFQNQWNGDNFDPDLPTKEDTRNTSGFRASLQAGLNWHFEQAPNSRTAIDAGIGAAHINQPSVHLSNNRPSALPIRWTIHAISTIQYTEITDLVVWSHAQRMGTATEILLGGGAQYWLTDELAFRAGVAGRFGDALIPSVRVQRNSWSVGASYDINLSGFKVATGRRGGFEIVLQYAPTPVKSPKNLKVCPIF